MDKRDNDKDYIEIVNEAGIGQKLLFKTSNIEAQNLMVHFEGGDYPSGVSLMSFQNFFCILSLHRNGNHRSLHDGDQFLFSVFQGMYIGSNYN